ncbi:MAG: metalloregulator ArsR/SmtB family transcription factor [Acidimicrobiales bacterium]|nr:metalloregulator ArsR/SmtB family transcription factor [Acidimicrobiales bacterium]
MPKHREAVDEVFHALADPTRRQVVERLVSGPATTSELAQPFDMSLPSFTHHLALLEAAHLVTSIKVGRVRTYRLASDGLDTADGWLAEQRRIWERRLDRMDAFVLDLKEHG